MNEQKCEIEYGCYPKRLTVLFCISYIKREWDRNWSFVRIRFRRPTPAQLSRAVKADEISVGEPTQPLRLARQSKDN